MASTAECAWQRHWVPCVALAIGAGLMTDGFGCSLELSGGSPRTSPNLAEVSTAKATALGAASLSRPRGQALRALAA